MSVGKELPDGTIADANYVWLSDWQLENINQNFLLPIDVETYRQLKNHISKSLVPLLQVWLFASHKAGSFSKRYDELCDILNLRKHRVPSQITRQLKPSLDELTAHGYLKAWRIEKTSDQKSYKMVLFHGPKFHRDRRKRLERRTAPPVVVAQSAPEEPVLPEPGTIEHTPRPDGESVDRALVEALTNRGVVHGTAIELVANRVDTERARIRQWIEYWDQIEGEKGPGLLVRFAKRLDPLPAGFETAEERTRRQSESRRQETLRRGREALELAYKEHGDRLVDRHLADLPPAEHDRLLTTYREEIVRDGGFFAQFKDGPSPVLDNAVRSLVRADIRRTVSLPSFDEFCQEEAGRLLAPLGLQPHDLGIVPVPSSNAQNSSTSNENARGEETPNPDASSS